MTSHFTATQVGDEGDPDVEIVAYFCAVPNDAPSEENTRVIGFSIDADAPEPWEGDPNTTDWFSNSYCIVSGEDNECNYGGLRQITFVGKQATFEIADWATRDLRLGQRVVVDFQVGEEELRAFKKMLVRVVTWGVPSQVPRLVGFD